MFASLCFGLALNLAIPGIPQGVAVMALIVGMLVAATVSPLSMTIFLVLVSNPELVSVIAGAAVRLHREAGDCADASGRVPADRGRREGRLPRPRSDARASSVTF